MNVEISMRGNRAQVINEVARVVKTAGRANPAAWPLLAAVRDHVGASLPSEGEVEVSVWLQIQVAEVAATVEVAAPASA